MALKVLRVLMEASPSDISVTELCSRLESVDGVGGVHDIHLTSVTSGFNVLSGHVVVRSGNTRPPRQILEDLRAIASRKYGIQHVTLQLEDDAPSCPERHHVQH